MDASADHRLDGYVRTEISTNRATFSASFQAVEKQSAEATRIAADKVRSLGKALAAYGSDKVRVETTFNMQPLYDQYRTKEGVKVEDQRADRIERYAVNAYVSIELRDVTLTERVYATVLAARPTSTSQVRFSLEPGNETKTALFREAIADAARRARLAVEASGARLGPVRLIDPTGRACETDVLVAGAARAEDQTTSAQTVGEVVVTAMRRGAPPPPAEAPTPPPPGTAGQALRPEDMQPPLETLQARACVIYALAS